MSLRSVKMIVLLSLTLVASIVFAGCGSNTDAGDETSGKPAVIYFWQPG